MATTEDHTGTYVKLNDFIALRDNNERSWRLSRVTVGDVSKYTSLHLEYVDTFDHLWQVREYVQRVEETEAGRIREVSYVDLP